MTHKLTAAVAEEAAPLVRALKRVGYRVAGSLYSPESFGNWYVDFIGPAGTLRITKDRGYFSIDGERSTLEAAGLWLFATQNCAELAAKVNTGLGRNAKSS